MFNIASLQYFVFKKKKKEKKSPLQDTRKRKWRVLLGTWSVTPQSSMAAGEREQKASNRGPTLKPTPSGGVSLTLIIIISEVYKLVTYLGTGNPDLWSCIDMDSAVCLSWYRAADCVRYSYGQGSSLLAVPQAHQRICCLTWKDSHWHVQCWSLLPPQMENCSDFQKRILEIYICLQV